MSDNSAPVQSLANQVDEMLLYLLPIKLYPDFSVKQFAFWLLFCSSLVTYCSHTDTTPEKQAERRA